MNMMFYGHNKPKGKVITTMTTVGDSIDMPLVGLNGGTIVIDWGDDSTDTFDDSTPSSTPHNYDVSGVYDITITSDNSFDVVFVYNRNLTALDISNNILLDNISCHGNNLTTNDINTTLESLDANGLLNGNCYTYGQTPSAPPTGDGITAKANLIAKGWTVTTD